MALRDFALWAKSLRLKLDNSTEAAQVRGRTENLLTVVTPFADTTVT